MKYEEAEKLVNSMVKIFDSPTSFIIFLLLLLTTFTPFLKKLMEYISLEDFDALFIPKQEMQLQKKIKITSNYIFVNFSYIIIGTIISLLIYTLQQKFSIDFYLNLISYSFGITFIPIVINIFLQTIIKKPIRLLARYKDSKIGNFLFYLNFSLSFFVYGKLLLTIFNNDNINITSLLFLIIFLSAVFYHYKYYFEKGDKTEFIVSIISLEEFNAAKPVLQYSIDSNRMVFKKLENDLEYLYMFEKSEDRFYKFIRK